MSNKAALGSGLLSTWINMFLFTVQLGLALKYFRTFPKDSTALKAVVCSALFIDMWATIALNATVYRDLITLFGEPTPSFAWSIPVTIGANVLSAVICESFLALRYFRLSRNYAVSVFLCFLIFATFVSGMIIAASPFFVPETNDLNVPIVRITLIISLVSTAVDDVITAGALVYELQKIQAASRIKSNNALLRRLSIHAVSSGVVVAALSVVMLIASNYPSISNAVGTLSDILGRVYSITMLFNLNSRIANRKAASKEVIMSDSTPAYVPSPSTERLSETHYDYEEQVGETVVSSHC